MLPSTEHKAPYYASFEIWLGRPLPAAQRRLITALEHARQNELYPRFLIHDDGSAGDIIRTLLIDYMRWVDLRLNPHNHSTLLIARTNLQARLLSPSTRFIPGSLRSPLSVWGQRYTNALILEADRASTRLMRYHDIRRVTYPVLPDRGILIIHGNARRWGTYFAEDFHHAATTPDSPIKAIAVNPLRERRLRKPRPPKPTELMLRAQADLRWAEKGLAATRWAMRNGRFSPDLERELRMWTAYVDRFRHLVKKETEIRDMLVENGRKLRRVLSLIYLISPHIPLRRPRKDTDGANHATDPVPQSPVSPFQSTPSHNNQLAEEPLPDIRARAPA